MHFSECYFCFLSRSPTFSLSNFFTLLLLVPSLHGKCMYRYESWTIKKTECIRIDAFELWCWRRLLRVLWTARRSNQLILKEINPEYSLGGLILKLQYFGHLMQRDLRLGKIEGRRRRGQQSFSCGAQTPGKWASVTVTRGLSSYGARA